MKLKLIGIGLLIALFSVVIYTQIYKPVIIQPKKLKGAYGI